MAFSNTVSRTTFNTRRVIDHAFRRCKIAAQLITSEYVDIATDQLYLLLSGLANDGVPLWCIERQLYGLYDGVPSVTLDVGTVDVLNANLRYLQEVTGTNTDAADRRTIQFDSETIVTSVGIKWSAAASPIALERSDDGATWTTVQSETPTAAAGEWSWYDLESFVASTYFRVRATSGNLDFETLYTGNSPTSVTLARINRDQWAALSNRAFKSARPNQYWFDRQVRQPVMHLNPTPNAASESYQIELWRHRHIMDVGTLAQEIEVPQRWYEVIVAQLAARLAREILEVDAALIPTLDADAANLTAKAQAEERDNSPTTWAPRIGMYTA